MILIRQIFFFGLIGLIQVLIDTGVLIGLTTLGATLVAANIAGRVAGACAGFLLNGTSTFSHQIDKRLQNKHLRRFLVSWTVLTAVSTLILYLANKHVTLELIWIAKPAIEICLAFVSFLVSKFWIYKR